MQDALNLYHVERSLEEVKDVVRRKLDLGQATDVSLKQMGSDALLDLEDGKCKKSTKWGWGTLNRVVFVHRRRFSGISCPFEVFRVCGHPGHCGQIAGSHYTADCCTRESTRTESW